MSIRDQLNDNAVLSGLALSVVFVIAMGYFTWRVLPTSSDEPGEQMAYFYDLNTKELFEGPASEAGPIETDSGPHQGMPAGVRANVYCCGPKVKGAQTFIGYLEVPTDAMPEELRPKMMNLSEDSEENEVLVRRPEEEAWHVIGSPEGQTIMTELNSHCSGDQQITYISPPKR